MEEEKLKEALQQAKVDYENALNTMNEKKNQVENLSHQVHSAQVEVHRTGTEVDQAAIHLQQSLQNLSLDKDEIVCEYTIEHLVNIACFQVYLIGLQENVCSNSSSSLQLHIKGKSVKVLNGTEEMWNHTFAFLINKASSTFYQKNDHIGLRLSYARPRDDNTTIVEMDTAAALSTYTFITESELYYGNYYQLSCAGCCASLLSPGKITRVFALPSSNWTLMTEFWGVQTNQCTVLKDGEIIACSGRGYIGETHLLLHASDFQEKAIEEKKESWQCTTCHTELCPVVGETLSIQKHDLCASNIKEESVGPVLNVLFPYTTARVLYMEMLDVAETIGVFKFQINSNSSDFVLIVQLLSWNSTLQTDVHPVSRRVLKVLYQSSTTSFSRSKGPVHVLEYDSDTLTRIHQSLEKSSECLPLSLRNVQERAVGFIVL